MVKVDHEVIHYFVASEEGINLVQEARKDLSNELRERLASTNPRVKRSGLVSLGVSTGLEMILRSEHPGPTGIQLIVDLKQALRSHNPSKEEMSAMLVRIHETLAPIWRKGAEENRRIQLREKRETQARTSRLRR